MENLALSTLSSIQIAPRTAASLSHSLLQKCLFIVIIVNLELNTPMSFWIS